jgi:hypothetical protein
MLYNFAGHIMILDIFKVNVKRDFLMVHGGNRGVKQSLPDLVYGKGYLVQAALEWSMERVLMEFWA